MNEKNLFINMLNCLEFLIKIRQKTQKYKESMSKAN